VGQRSRVRIEDLEEYTGAKWPESNAERKEKRTGLWCCPGYNHVSNYYLSVRDGGACWPLGSYGYNYFGIMPPERGKWG
jgi:hypothetical protein